MPQPARRGLGFGLVVPLLLAVAAERSVGAEDQKPKPAAAPAIIHLRNGGHLAGLLSDSREEGLIRWQGTAFTKAFEFPVGAINAIHYPVPAVLPKPEGDYCFELAGGDVVFGSITSLEADRAILQIPGLGETKFDRGAISRIYRWKSSADLIYLGPSGLSGWREPASKNAWKEEQGQPWTDQDGALIRSEIGLPGRAAVEFEISWKNKPDFVLALGIDADEKSIQRAFRFEVWERDMIVQRETEQEADVASVGEIAAGPGRIHLVAYLDQEKGRILVFTAEGKPLADLKVGSVKTATLGGISLANKHGDLRLERLRISRWNGEPPRQVEQGQSRIHLADGGIVYGKVERYDPAAKAFTVVDAKGKSTLPADQIAGVYLPTSVGGEPRSVAIVYQNGTRISGSLLSVEASALSLRVPGVDQPLSLPSAGLRSVVSMGAAAEPAAMNGQSGLLELNGDKIAGCLVEGGVGAECLVWQPQGSRTASPLQTGGAGRVFYRAAPNPKPLPPVASQPEPPRGAAGFVSGFLTALGGQPNAGSGKRKSLYLRSGDVIPSEITAIDELGVKFRTALSTSTFVTHDKVQAVELAHPTESGTKLTKAKRDRLLTLPRMQKENPPTQLVRSRNGDFLRGRLIKLDDKSMVIEIRLEEKAIPRDRLATIVWLHPTQGTAAAAANEGAVLKPPPTNQFRVQAVCHDGIRLTFQADRMTNGVLSGTSEVLGPCKVALKDIDQVLIGDGIEKAAAQMVYQQWRLQDAPSPREASSDGSSSSGRPAGTESALVGQPAPDFELDLLDGKKFRLAEARGKPVILDFWATWCGPCLQAMPQVEQVASEFQDRGVRLIAVNLQEEPDQIRAMLQRHKLHPTVALDRDGAVAEKYAAAAIPQTVVIDAEGKISRLFVGGGNRLADQLREALQGVLPGAAAKPSSSP